MKKCTFILLLGILFSVPALADHLERSSPSTLSGRGVSEGCNYDRVLPRVAAKCREVVRQWNYRHSEGGRYRYVYRSFDSYNYQVERRNRPFLGRSCDWSIDYACLYEVRRRRH